MRLQRGDGGTEFRAMKNTGKALVVYSGGLDSTVLLYKLASQSRAAGALGFLYGQRHAKELEFAQYNCDRTKKSTCPRATTAKTI